MTLSAKVCPHAPHTPREAASVRTRWWCWLCWSGVLVVLVVRKWRGLRALCEDKSPLLECLPVGVVILLTFAALSVSRFSFSALRFAAVASTVQTFSEQ